MLLNGALPVVAVRAHCGACGTVAAFTGDTADESTALWATAHYRPVIDEIDIATPFGVQTWRHT